MKNLGFPWNFSCNAKRVFDKGEIFDKLIRTALNGEFLTSAERSRTGNMSVFAAFRRVAGTAF